MHLFTNPEFPVVYVLAASVARPVDIIDLREAMASRVTNRVSSFSHQLAPTSNSYPTTDGLPLSSALSGAFDVAILQAQPTKLADL